MIDRNAVLFDRVMREFKQSGFTTLLVAQEPASRIADRRSVVEHGNSEDRISAARGSIVADRIRKYLTV